MASETSKLISLYGFHKPSPNVPSGSAFCQKLETYFRFAGIPYDNEDATPNNAPKGKLPYVKFQDDSILADSHIIIRHLIENGHTDLDGQAGLTEIEKADGIVYRGYLEDHVYPAIVYTRWMIPENYYDFIEDQFKGNSWVYKKLISNLAYYGVKSCLKGHGVGRHTPEEVDALLELAIGAVKTRLIVNQKDGGDWFFGKKGPSEVDAALYGVLATTSITPSTPLVNRLVAESSSLSWYILNITEKYFAEYDELITRMRKNLESKNDTIIAEYDELFTRAIEQRRNIVGE